MKHFLFGLHTLKKNINAALRFLLPFLMAEHKALKHFLYTQDSQISFINLR